MAHRPNLANVQWLTVAELSELWADNLTIPKTVIQRELQLALFKIEQAKTQHERFEAFVKEQPGEDKGRLADEFFGKPLDVIPPDADLPSLGTYIGKDFVDRFCKKQEWALPEFWFQDLPVGPAFPGRPSIMRAIVQELERIEADDQLEDSLAAQARVLERWARDNYPGRQTPRAKSIENGIRIAYRAFKNPN